VFTEYFFSVYECKFPKHDACLNLKELDYDVNTESNRKGNKGSIRRLSCPLKMVFLNSVINPVQLVPSWDVGLHINYYRHDRPLRNKLSLMVHIQDEMRVNLKE